MPATIIAVLFSANPAAAADNPVIALSSEITTGMSAPPIGSTTSRPSTPRRPAASDRSTTRGAALPVETRSRPRRPTRPAAAALLSGCWSLAEADRPAGEEFLQLAEGHQRAPERHRPDDRGEQRRRPPCAPSATRAERREPVVSMNSAQAISATVPPPTPLNSATSCGIAVILVFLAGGTPSTMPMARPATIRHPVARCGGSRSASRPPRWPCRPRRSGCRAPRSWARSDPSGRR